MSAALDDYFAYCPDFAFTAGLDSAVLRMSASLARFLGADSHDGAKLAELTHPNDRKAFEVAWSQIQAGAASLFTFRIRRADGDYVAVSCSASKSAARDEVHGSLRESAAEERTAVLEQHAELLGVVEQNIPMTIWTVDKEGTFLHHAGKGIEAAGMKQGQLLGRNIFQVYAGGQGVVKVREAFAGSIGHTISKQHEIYWETWYIPVRDAQGDVARVAGLTLDISAVTRAENELREKIDVIARQQQVIRALSTPIIEVWDKVLTLPMLGVVDEQRAADLIESLLNQVIEKRARFAVIDLTGVDTIDTSTASHLLRMTHAVRLLGAEGIIAGIRPAVAQTMVALGIDMKRIATRANLRDCLQYCIRRMNREGDA